MVRKYFISPYFARLQSIVHNYLFHTRRILEVFLLIGFVSAEVFDHEDGAMEQGLEVFALFQTHAMS